MKKRMKKLVNPVFWYHNQTNKTRGKAYFAGIRKMLLRGDRVIVKRFRRVDTGQKIINIAKKFLETVEMPPNSNSGEQVRRFQASTTEGGTGWPWCQAFVRFVLDGAGVQKDGYRGAYVPHYVAWAKASGKWTQSPKKGYAVVFEFDSDYIVDHVGFFVQKNSDGSILTVEGNTSRSDSGSQSNGGGVFMRRRNKNNILGYIKTH